MALPAFSVVGRLVARWRAVWTDADEFGDTFERPAHIEHDTPIDGVLHSLVEIGEQRCCSLDGDEIDEFQSGCSHLAGELAWSMRVPGERPWEQWAQHTAAFDVAELVEDVGQISVHLLGQHTVEMSCPPGDRRDEYRASGSHDASRLAQRLQSVTASLEGGKAVRAASTASTELSSRSSSVASPTAVSMSPRPAATDSCSTWIGTTSRCRTV